MALFGKGEDKLIELIQENATLKANLEAANERKKELQAQVESLQDQVYRLQDALVAKEAPLAYRDRRDSEEEAGGPVRSTADQKLLREKAMVNRRLLDQIESPTFQDGDDFIRSMTGVDADELLDKLMGPGVTGTPTPAPIHGHEEG